MAGSKVHQLKRLVSLNLARLVQRLVQEGVSLGDSTWRECVRGCAFEVSVAGGADGRACGNRCVARTL